MTVASPDSAASESGEDGGMPTAGGGSGEPMPLAPARPSVVVLNGGSSSGKSSIARQLQDQLGPTWLTLGVDDLIRALPGGEGAVDAGPSVDFGSDGSVTVGEDFRRAETAWYAGLAAMGLTGVGLIVDEVFMDSGSSQARSASALSGVSVKWVGVRCDAEIAAARERTRPDRVAGMARLQAERVHLDVQYDLVVDTTMASAAECADSIAAMLFVRRQLEWLILAAATGAAE